VSGSGDSDAVSMINFDLIPPTGLSSKMKKNIRIVPLQFLLCLVLFLPLVPYQHCCGQFSTDSLLSNLKKKPHFFFQFDAVNSFISGRGANSIGVKAGLDFGKRIKFGTGYYTLISDIVEKKYIAEYDSVYNVKLQMNYYTTFVDYVLLEKGKWQLSLLNQFGIGNSYFWYYANRDPDKNKVKTLSNRLVVLYEPSVTAQYKVLKWVGGAVGLGYRTMLLTNKEIDHRLSSPVFSIRIKIFLDEIYKSIWPDGLLHHFKKSDGTDGK
jgi:hypothetical protein